jgi:4-amino-4-deoxy-L-arabinose transferase-like glycosyltransferase
MLLSTELRLAYALLLQAAALVGAWRFVRRRVGTDAIDRATDALLLNFLVQYAAVAIPGMLGVLHPLTLGLVTLAASAGLYFAPTKAAVPEHARVEPAWEGWTVATCTLFVLGYLATVAYEQAFAPALAQDALTYHFPAAAQWLRTGRLGLFETWFFNPANTYSPLAGSAFIAWWMAPLGNDVLARHVPFPALVLVFFAAIRLIRALGARPAVAALIAAALVLSQPFIRQSIIEKDDLYLAAFFTCVAAGCGRERLRDALGGWRIGVALGLLLAMKYTALFALPALVLLVDAPIRAGWSLRRYGVVAGAVLLLAGPWYLRNALLTGNPLYPVDVKVFGVTIFKGLFESARSEAFSRPGEFLGLLTRRHQSLPPWPAAVVALAWVAALAGRFRTIWTDPLLRACLLGPILAMAVFWWRAPYAEIRFVFPAFVLLYASAAVAIAAWLPHAGVQLFAAAIVLVPSWATGFWIRTITPEAGGPGDAAAGVNMVAQFCVGASIVTLVGLAVMAILRGAAAPAPTAEPPVRGRGRSRTLNGAPSEVAAPSRWGRRAAPLYLGGAAFVATVAYAFVFWAAFVTQCREFWVRPAQVFAHGDLAEAWYWVCDKLPPAEPLAYTNTFLVHPLSGFTHERPLVYVPTRRGVAHIHDLPHLPGRLSGERLEPAFAAALAEQTDADGWLAKLKASGATHLFLAKHGPLASPPEVEIVRAHPERFESVFDNSAATVYRLK